MKKERIILKSDVHQILDRARTRLRRRYLLRGMRLGFGWAAAIVLILAVGSRFWWPLGTLSPWVVLCCGLGVGALLGGFLGAFQPILGTRQLALLLDRTFQTDETLVTQLHLLETGKAEEHPDITEDLSRRIAALPALSERLPLSANRRMRWPLVVAIIGFLALLFPQRKDAVVDMFKPQTTPLQDQVSELEDAIDDITEKYETPLSEEVNARLEELSKTLSDGDLSSDEAAAEIQDVQEMLESLESSLQEAADELEHLEDAADELATQEETRDLAEALEQADMDASADAVESLMEQMEQASSQEKEQIGEQLERAGQQLSNSENEQMKRAGEAMEEAGQQLQNEANGTGKETSDNSSGEQSNESQGTTPSSQETSSGENTNQGDDKARQNSGQNSSARQSMERLQQQLRDNERVAEQMKQDAERLKQSQELNGALEAANQGVGGQPGVDGGQGQEQGQGEGQGQGQGQGEGQGQGQGQGASGVGTQNGSAHTWEDAGTHDTTSGYQDRNRLSNRTGGMDIDDFEQFYAPIRMEGAEGAITGVTGEIDESGQLETLPSRLTEGQETSTAPSLNVPEGYKDAAERAMNNERVPPGYRNSVREYFESVE